MLAATHRPGLGVFGSQTEQEKATEFVRTYAEKLLNGSALYLPLSQDRFVVQAVKDGVGKNATFIEAYELVKCTDLSKQDKPSGYRCSCKTFTHLNDVVIREVRNWCDHTFFVAMCIRLKRKPMEGIDAREAMEGSVVPIWEYKKEPLPPQHTECADPYDPSPQFWYLSGKCLVKVGMQYGSLRIRCTRQTCRSSKCCTDVTDAIRWDAKKQAPRPLRSATPAVPQEAVDTSPSGQKRGLETSPAASREDKRARVASDEVVSCEKSGCKIPGTLFIHVKVDKQKKTREVKIYEHKGTFERCGDTETAIVCKEWYLATAFQLAPTDPTPGASKPPGFPFVPVTHLCHRAKTRFDRRVFPNKSLVRVCHEHTGDNAGIADYDNRVKEAWARLKGSDNTLQISASVPVLAPSTPIRSPGPSAVHGDAPTPTTATKSRGPSPAAKPGAAKQKASGVLGGLRALFNDQEGGAGAEAAASKLAALVSRWESAREGLSKAVYFLQEDWNSRNKLQTSLRELWRGRGVGDLILKVNERLPAESRLDVYFVAVTIHQKLRSANSRLAADQWKPAQECPVPDYVGDIDTRRFPFSHKVPFSDAEFINSPNTPLDLERRGDVRGVESYRVGPWWAELKVRALVFWPRSRWGGLTMVPRSWSEHVSLYGNNDRILFPERARFADSDYDEGEEGEQSSGAFW